MMIHVQVIKKGGKKEFVVLPYREFLRIREVLEDFEDLKELRKAKKREKNKKSIPLEKVVEMIELKSEI